MLFNECNIGKTTFNLFEYKLGLLDNNEAGIMSLNIFYLNISFEELEDNNNYNMIRMVDANNDNLIIYCEDIHPGNEHNNRVNELIEKLLLVNRNYHSLSLRLYGYLIIERKYIKNKIVDKIEPYGFKKCYNNDENIFTHEQKSENKI